jgi:hypothetical protein
MVTKFGTSISTDTKPYCFYDEIKQLIYEIYDIHNNFSGHWIEQHSTYTCNLKKKQVRHVFLNQDLFILDEDFYSNIKKYLTKLKELIINIDLDYTYNKYDFRSRVKQDESIVNKLKYYQVGKEGRGAYALNKCLNDLLGFRIAVEEFDHDCEIFHNMCLEISSQINIKKINSSKNDYKATHIYFYGESNKYFPWELQIWNPIHVTTNDISHAQHKQEYTKWAKIYKNSKEIETR